MSSPRRSSSSRPLSLHPSALSDAEHSLFTDSLAELTDGDGQSDWAHASISAREARAWIRGRYAALASGLVDEIFRLFPSTLSAGEFFAVLRLVLHGLSGHSVQRSLVFVQASVAAPTPSSLPTPAPSPDLNTRPPLPPRKPTLPALGRRDSDNRSSSSSRSTTSASSARTAPSPSSAVLPPTHSLRRTVSSSPTKTRTPVPDFASSVSANATASAKPTVHRAVSIGGRSAGSGGGGATHNPFRAGPAGPAVPPRPPQRRESTSVPASPSEVDVPVHASPFSTTSHSSPSPEPGLRTPRTAPPTNNSFLLARAAPPPPPPAALPVHARVSQFEAAYGSYAGQPVQQVDTGGESARWQPGGEAWGPL